MSRGRVREADSSCIVGARSWSFEDKGIPKLELGNEDVDGLLFCLAGRETRAPFYRPAVAVLVVSEGVVAVAARVVSGMAVALAPFCTAQR